MWFVELGPERVFQIVMVSWRQCPSCLSPDASKAWSVSLFMVVVGKHFAFSLIGVSLLKSPLNS